LSLAARGGSGKHASLARRLGDAGVTAGATRAMEAEEVAMKVLAWAAAVGVTVLAACAGTHQEATGLTSGGMGGEGGAAAATTGAGAGPTATATTGPTTTSTGTVTLQTTSSSTSSSSSGGSSAVSVIVTPDTTAITQIVAAINAATTSVHMTMYILDNTSVVNALIARKKAGLDVRVVMNQTFPTGTVQSNPTTYTKLTAAGIGVVWRNGPPGQASGNYTHEKTFIVDGKVAWIMTLNLDASSAEYNREYLVVDTTAADVAEADAIFLADFAGTATSDGAPLVVAPNNARSALVALIASATKTVDVEVEEFSDNANNGVTAAVAAAAKRGVTTRVILAQGTPESAQTTAISTVKAAGAKVVVSGGTSGGGTATNPYIHAKAITVDCSGTTCARAFLGSENFSGGSLGYNRELGVIIDSPTQIALVQTAINHDFSAGTAQ
jgi:cardiolipin synthase